MKYGIVALGIFALMASFCSVAVAADEVKEIEFKAGEAAPAPVEGYTWCLIKKPATYKVDCDKIEVRPEQKYTVPVAAEWGTEEETIVVAPEMKKATYHPATYENKQIEVIIEPETKALRVIPAKFEWVEQDLVVDGGCDNAVYTPAEYKMTQKKIEIEPEHVEIQEVDCKAGSSNMCGEKQLACYVPTKIPARYQTVCVKELVKEGAVAKAAVSPVTAKVKVKKLVAEATTEEYTIPAVKKTICQRVVVEPAHYTFETIPAQTVTVMKKVKIKDGGTKEVTIPAEYSNVSKQEMVAPAMLVWRQVPVSDCRGVSATVKKYGSLPGTGE